MTIAWGSLVLLVLLLPGFLFFLGIYWPEKFTRENEQRSPLGQLAAVLLVSVLVGATNGTVLATEAQVESIARVCAAVARFEGWAAESIGRRIVGHDAEAIWTPAYTA